MGWNDRGFAISKTTFGNCCKDCSERHVGCHSTCETYIAKKEEYLKAKRIHNDMQFEAQYHDRRTQQKKLQLSLQSSRYKRAAFKMK